MPILNDYSNCKLTFYPMSSLPNKSLQHPRITVLFCMYQYYIAETNSQLGHCDENDYCRVHLDCTFLFWSEMDAPLLSALHLMLYHTSTIQQFLFSKNFLTQRGFDLGTIGSPDQHYTTELWPLTFNLAINL